MKALIMIGEGFEDSEFFYPYYRLREEGIEVDVAAPQSGQVTGKHGYSFNAQITIEEAVSNEYDVLILPGGKGPEAVRLIPQAVEIVQKICKQDKPIGAICHGGQILISADVLKDKKATCWKGIKDDLLMAGAQYTDSEVVVDGNLVTSRCPGDLPAFSRELMQLTKTLNV
jgi:protease I